MARNLSNGGRVLVGLCVAAAAVVGCSYARPAPIGPPGPASWWLDPAFAAPEAGSVEIPILVEERACSSGRSADDRIAAPEIELKPHSIRITISVFPAPGDVQTCQGNPATPFVVVLPEPLGDRQLVGDVLPPDLR